MRKQDFALFWAIHPTEQDWANLNLSGCQVVMLTYQLAKDPTLLAHLTSLQKRVVIRIEQDNVEPAFALTATLRDIARNASIIGVILGCEPDNGLDWRYASTTTWGQEQVYQHRSRVDVLRGAVRAAGLPAISPAISHPPDAISEDGVLAPGRYTFAELVRSSYDMCDGAGGHLYSLGWGNDVNDLRFKFSLKQLCETWHKPVWLDEVGIILGDDTEKMRAYLHMADMVMRHVAGERVVFFCPFISAGDPGDPQRPAWDPRYLLKDSAAYKLLGEWMVR